MSLQDDFVNPISACMNANFTFPPITAPGLPNFALSCFLANFAGINYALQFIPPTPEILPDIAPPSIDLFLNAFMGSIKLPPSYPSITLGPLTIPGVGSPPYAYDVAGEMKMIAVCIVLPFQLITDLITGLLELEIRLPTLSGIYNIFVNLAIQAGLAGVSVAQFGLCLAQAIFDLFQSLI